MKKITLIIICILTIGILFFLLKPSNEINGKTIEILQEGNYTLQEVSNHNSSTDCLIAYNSSIYNITPFVASGLHSPIIKSACGKDITLMFDKKHSPAAKQKLQGYYIGKLI